MGLSDPAQKTRRMLSVSSLHRLSCYNANMGYTRYAETAIKRSSATIGKDIRERLHRQQARRFMNKSTVAITDTGTCMYKYQRACGH